MNERTNAVQYKCETEPRNEGRKERGGAAGRELHEASMEEEGCTQERGGEARFLITGSKESKDTGML